MLTFRSSKTPSAGSASPAQKSPKRPLPLDADARAQLVRMADGDGRSILRHGRSRVRRNRRRRRPARYHRPGGRRAAPRRSTTRTATAISTSSARWSGSPVRRMARQLRAINSAKSKALISYGALPVERRCARDVRNRGRCRSFCNRRNGNARSAGRQSANGTYFPSGRAGRCEAPPERRFLR